MKYLWQAIKEARYWLITFVALVLCFSLFTWLMDLEAWTSVQFIIIALPIPLAFIPIMLNAQKYRQLDEAAQAFWQEQNDYNERQWLNELPLAAQDQLKVLLASLKQKDNQLNQQNIELKQYKNYIEEWVHEIKKPLALISLVIENRSDQMSPIVLERMVHARNQIKNHVDQILYYARMNSSHRDYRFETLELTSVIHFALAENASILQETAFKSTIQGQAARVVSDKKSLIFILSQLINNSVKYVQTEPKELIFTLNQINTTATLRIEDNGPGVAKEDLPFIFDQAFTGHGSSSTGMGLHLVKQLAEDLSIKLTAESIEGKGLAIILSFPLHEEHLLPNRNV